MTVERAQQIVAGLREGGVQLAAYVPDSWLSPLIDAVVAADDITHVRTCREDDAVAVAGGAALMGKRAVVLCQNAGVLLSSNVLAAFALHHQLPLMIIAAARGGADDGFYYQMYKGQVTSKVASGIGLTVHDVRTGADDGLFARGMHQAWLQRRPVLLLCSHEALLGGAA